MIAVPVADCDQALQGLALGVGAGGGHPLLGDHHRERQQDQAAVDQEQLEHAVGELGREAVAGAERADRVRSPASVSAGPDDADDGEQDGRLAQRPAERVPGEHRHHREDDRAGRRC